MEHDEIQTEVYAILRSLEGRFATSYQIAIRLEEAYPELWNRLRSAYPTGPGAPAMGGGAGRSFTPASFIAVALQAFHRRDGRVRMEWFDSTNMTFAGVEPGFRGGWVAIWAWQEES